MWHFLKLESSGRLWYAELRFTPCSGSVWLGYSGVARWGGGVGSKGQLQLRTCLSHFLASKRCTYCASLTQLWLLLLYCLSRITIWCYMLMKGRLTCWPAASSAGTWIFPPPQTTAATEQGSRCTIVIGKMYVLMTLVDFWCFTAVVA